MIDRFQEFIKVFKITPKRLNITTGISIRECYRIYNGEHMPSLHNLAKIKRAFPLLSLNYIISGKAETIVIDDTKKT